MTKKDFRALERMRKRWKKDEQFLERMFPVEDWDGDFRDGTEARRNLGSALAALIAICNNAGDWLNASTGTASQRDRR